MNNYPFPEAAGRLDRLRTKHAREQLRAIRDLVGSLPGRLALLDRTDRVRIKGETYICCAIDIGKGGRLVAYSERLRDGVMTAGATVPVKTFSPEEITRIARSLNRIYSVSNELLALSERFIQGRYARKPTGEQPAEQDYMRPLSLVRAARFKGHDTELVFQMSGDTGPDTYESIHAGELRRLIDEGTLQIPFIGQTRFFLFPDIPDDDTIKRKIRERSPGPEGIGDGIIEEDLNVIKNHIRNGIGPDEAVGAFIDTVTRLNQNK